MYIYDYFIIYNLTKWAACARCGVQAVRDWCVIFCQNRWNLLLRRWICTKDDWFCTEVDGLCTGNDGFCTKNDGFWTEHDLFVHTNPKRASPASRSLRTSRRCPSPAVRGLRKDVFLLKHDDFLLKKWWFDYKMSREGGVSSLQQVARAGDGSIGRGAEGGRQPGSAAGADSRSTRAVQASVRWGEFYIKNHELCIKTWWFLYLKRWNL